MATTIILVPYHLCQATKPHLIGRNSAHNSDDGYREFDQFAFQSILNWCEFLLLSGSINTLQWHHNGRNGVSNHQPHDCLLNRRSKKASKLGVTGLCAGNSPVTGEFPAQMSSSAENVSILWRHHDLLNHHDHKPIAYSTFQLHILSLCKR